MAKISNIMQMELGDKEVAMAIIDEATSSIFTIPSVKRPCPEGVRGFKSHPPH